MYKIVNQIKTGFIFKLLAVLSSYVLVPITLNYLGKEQYGVWITLLSVVSWVSFLDIGIGNGMRNRLTECIAVNDIESAKKYVSTSYIILSVFALFILIAVCIVTDFIDLTKLLNTDKINNYDLRILVKGISCFIIINFVLSLINQIFNATHKAFMSSLNQFLGNGIALVATYVAIKFTSNNLLLIALIYCFSLCSSNLILSLYFFNKQPHLAPSFHSYDKTKIKSITSLGIQIFIIQIAAMVVFTSDNIVITHFLDPKNVTDYNIVNRLFSVVIIAHSILMAPLWSAFTDAYTNKNIIWIRSALKKLNILMLPLVLSVVLLSALSKAIIHLWVGDNVIFNNSLIFFIGIFVIVLCWNNIYAFFLNGISVTRIQIITSIIAILLKMAFLYFVISINILNLELIVVSSIIALLPFALLGYLQTYKILKEREI